MEGCGGEARDMILCAPRPAEERKRTVRSAGLFLFLSGWPPIFSKSGQRAADAGVSLALSAGQGKPRPFGSASGFYGVTVCVLAGRAHPV